MEKNPVNVLFINHSVRDGGPGRSLFYILKYLDRDKINPHIIIPKDDIFSEDLKAENIYENVIVDKRFPENIFSARLGLDIFSASDKSNVLTKFKKFVFSLINIFDLILFVLMSGKIIKNKKIDIVYCNGTIAKIVGAFIGKINNRSVIWHVRNIQQTKVLKFIITNLSKFSAVKRIICVSNATAEQFSEVSEKVRVVYNGIDPNDYNPQKTRALLRKEFNIKKDTILIGSTGRLVPRKGYDDLIKVAKNVIDKLDKSIDIKFVIVGDTPHFFQFDHLSYLKNLANKLHIAENLIFTGYKKDIRPYLKDFDIFVIPSNYPDPFPRSVIEAMSFKLPVIGFKIGGIAEAVEHSSSGYLSETSDYEDMAEKIHSLIVDNELRIEMGKNARKRVIKMCKALDRSKDIENIILETPMKI